MTDRELMQQALDALESDCGATKFGASEALRARLAQPEPEPVAWMYNGNLHEFDPSDWAEGEVIPLYTAPPQREWQGLTAKDLAEIPPNCYEGAIWADAKLKEKNT